MESVLIGKIINTHGIKGEVKIFPYTDDINNFSYLKTIYLDENLTDKYEIIKNRVSKNVIISKLKNVDDMNEAEKLKDRYIYVKRDSLQQLEEGTYYINDILGFCVKTIDNEILGTLNYVFNSGANDVYEVKTKNDKFIYLPAIKDVIKKVDIDKKEIIVKLMDGLL